MIIIKVINCSREKEIIQITEEAVTSKPYSSSETKLLPAIRLQISPIEFYYFQKEITNWNSFVKLLLANKNLLNRLLILKFLPNTITTVDYKWSCIAHTTLMEKIEAEHLFSWLSTLGGGYSALGDSFQNCSKIAAKISLHQLALCHKLGDPHMQARCKLFYSISLIQQGRLRLAKRIIRQQYKFAQSQTIEDTRLIKMCQGIWVKLQHSYADKLLDSKS